MRRIVITGASGYLGTRVVDLLRCKYDVFAIVRRSAKESFENVTYVEVDLSKPWSTQKLPGAVDGVIHLAQARDYRKFPDKATEIFAVNATATALLLDYARRAGASSFILASTGGVYGEIGDTITSATPVNPPAGELGYYFRTKLAAEMLVHSYSGLMSINVLRPFFIYGPGQPDDRLIGRIVDSVCTGRRIQLAGEDGICLNPIYIDDAAELIDILLDRPGTRVLNVAGPDAVTIRYIAEVAGEILGRVPQFEKVSHQSGRIVADHLPMADLLARQLVGFDVGLAAAIGRIKDQ